MKDNTKPLDTMNGKNTSAITQPNEFIVYFAHSPQHGPHICLISGQDIQAAGGICGVEEDFRQETYWFYYLTRVIGVPSEGCQCMFDKDLLDAIPVPPRSAMQLGRCHPAFHAGDFERRIFDAIADSIQATLDTWTQLTDGTPLENELTSPDGDQSPDSTLLVGDAYEAYVLTSIAMTSERLAAVATALRAHNPDDCVLRVQTFKYWYGPDWAPVRFPSKDLILDLVTLTMPVRVTSSTAGDCPVKVEVLSRDITYVHSEWKTTARQLLELLQKEKARQ